MHACSIEAIQMYYMLEFSCDLRYPGALIYQNISNFQQTHRQRIQISNRTKNRQKGDNPEYSQRIKKTKTEETRITLRNSV